MKKIMKKTVVCLMCTFLGASAITVMPDAPFTITSEAHQGRTDANGGHHDKNNKSGLGDYHYHCGGNPAHLHTGGACPYSASTSAASNQQSTDKATTAETASSSTGWCHDHNGWRYELSDNHCYSSEITCIDGKNYCFDENGYMVTGWHQNDDDWYYFNTDGSMATGEQEIDKKLYYFNSNGIMDSKHHSSGCH